MMIFARGRGVKASLAILAVVATAACSRSPDELAGADGASLGRAGVAAPGSQQDFVVNVGDRVYFEQDSSEVSGAGQQTLDKQARWLQQYGRYAFSLEGHADEQGTREYNFALGARRAEAAKNYLIARGISGSRIATKSFGKERPVAVCNNESCYSQNRRAVTVLNGGQS